MEKTIKVTDEFAVAMQQLSAEAEKTLAPSLIPQSTGESHSLEQRLNEVESALAEKIDMIAVSNGSDLVNRFQKIDEQLLAIRNSETVNQRLFDTMHEEMLKYRDNFLHETLQKPFIHDLIHLYDDLSSLSEQLRNAAEEKGQGHVVQWRDNLENGIHALIEVLHRFEVKEIEAKENVDRAFHKVVSFEPADYAEEDGRIVMRVKRGFFWRGKLIRPEEVIAKRYQ